MKVLHTNPTLVKCAKPVLWHTDLHLGNIYVSPDKPSQILSIIDWQSISILPLFMQARWPIFLEKPENFTEGLQKPELPDNFDELDPDEQELAEYEQQKALAAKAYEISSIIESKEAHAAMKLPRVFRELFIRCGEPSEVGVIPLRSCLIKIFQHWRDLGFPAECPYQFSEEEITEHDTQFKEYEYWHRAHELARKCLSTDEDGWIPPDWDIAERRQKNQEMLDMFVEYMGAEKSPEEARQMWPFVEGRMIPNMSS